MARIKKVEETKPKTHPITPKTRVKKVENTQIIKPTNDLNKSSISCASRSEQSVLTVSILDGYRSPAHTSSSCL